jgi:hypothetical protein
VLVATVGDPVNVAQTYAASLAQGMARAAAFYGAARSRRSEVQGTVVSMTQVGRESTDISMVLREGSQLFTSASVVSVLGSAPPRNLTSFVGDAPILVLREATAPVPTIGTGGGGSGSASSRTADEDSGRSIWLPLAIVLGCVLLALLVIGVVLLYRRRKRSTRFSSSTADAAPTSAVQLVNMKRRDDEAAERGFDSQRTFEHSPSAWVNPAGVAGPSRTPSGATRIVVDGSTSVPQLQIHSSRPGSMVAETSLLPLLDHDRTVLPSLPASQAALGPLRESRAAPPRVLPSLRPEPEARSSQPLVTAVVPRRESSACSLRATPELSMSLAPPVPEACDLLDAPVLVAPSRPGSAVPFASASPVYATVQRRTSAGRISPASYSPAVNVENAQPTIAAWSPVFGPVTSTPFPRRSVYAPPSASGNALGASLGRQSPAQSRRRSLSGNGAPFLGAPDGGDDTDNWAIPNATNA